MVCLFCTLDGYVCLCLSLAGKAAENGPDGSTHAAAPDLKEMFSLGPGNPAAGFPSRIFPTNPPDFAAAWTLYYDTLAELGRTILSAFALALGLEERHFDQFVDHHASALRF